MPAYKIAALRHWNDAQHLEAEARLPNADQLYGIAAECALKSVMLGLNMPMHPNGTRPASPFAVHVNLLWPLFHSFANGPTGQAYVNLVPNANPFQCWSVHDRYEDGNTFTAAVVQARKDGAKQTIDCLNLARLNGVAK